jgi:pyruvate,orthophosphate dikinase
LLAYDSYRRFIEDFGTVVFRLGEKYFDQILITYLNGLGKKSVKELGAGQIEALVALYLSRLAEIGTPVPEDAYEQLRLSVSAIYRSWYSEKAMQFRKAMNVSDHWGTSVLIMQMVCGNEKKSGASVFFTRKPHSMEKGIYGDTKEDATGADLVSGRLAGLPLARQQASRGQKSLEELDPQLFRMHEELALKIEKAMKGLPQEVEATYTTGADGERHIYVLQTKRMEIHRGFTKRFQDVCEMHSNNIGRGVGVNGGALSGVATFSSSPERIRETGRNSGMPVIVLRAMASTDDVSLMPEVDGIITVTGGVSSHASILAQKFDLTAVVGCTDMHMYTDEKGEPFAKIGDYTVKEGTMLSIDGSTGLVYSGSCESIFWERG